MRVAGNEDDLREAAGAFGDLGTLIPFVVGSITLARMDPVGLLVAFGIFKVIAGLYFPTPVPIQPMKAIGTAAIGHAGTISPATIWASGLFTGILWLVLGLTGAVSWIARLTSRPIVQRLVLGLGLTFVLECGPDRDASSGGRCLTGCGGRTPVIAYCRRATGLGEAVADILAAGGRPLAWLRSHAMPCRVDVTGAVTHPA